MLIHFAILNLQLDNSKTLEKNSPSRTYRRHWGILQDLVLDRKVLVLVAERDTAVGARRTEGHCDDTRRRKKSHRFTWSWATVAHRTCNQAPESTGI